MVHIPFRTSPIFELAGSHVDITFDAAISAFPMLKGGKLRALAVTSTEPWPSVPTLPSLAAALPGYDISTFLGLVGPAGMPQDVVQRLNQEIRRVLALPEVRRGFAELGTEPRASSPEEMHKVLDGEIAKWVRLVESRNIEKQ
jgi:tripartite-type tricarboxylate transporter receptor subunit TctC